MLYLAGKRDFCFEDTCVTLGKFDGIHRGHELLLERMSDTDGLARVVFTFALSDSKLLLGEGTDLIFTVEERRNYIEDGDKADILISYPFDRSTRDMDAEAFIRDVIVRRLGAKAVVVGTDFKYRSISTMNYIHCANMCFAYRIKELFFFIRH